MQKVTIVMYHYVRDLKNSDYPGIKGLDTSLFREQLGYILKYYNVISMETLIEASKNKANLPERAALLTFDDGYKDHFETVFPILDTLGIQGSFFPSAKAISEHKVLDVNKIHFVLASAADKNTIISDIYSLLDEYREKYSLCSNEYYYKKLAVPGRFDNAEIVFIKRVLQRELPSKLRTILADLLFKKYVSKNESSFSRGLYLNSGQLKQMGKRGMYVGVHGYDHCWLDTLMREQQEAEIKNSLGFLKKNAINSKDFAFCYPYGAYNASLLGVLEEYGCSLALTTNAGIADLEKDSRFILPRLDTNDLPKNSLAKPTKWTLLA